MTAAQRALDLEPCRDLAEYDPFEPMYILVEDGSEYIDSEPMTSDDWEAWLACE